jgi:hypothetical protein
MWTYQQSSGELSHDGKLIAQGYSGFGDGKNNPAMETVIGVGPIPRGYWTIAGLPEETEEHGPYVLVLVPNSVTASFSRSGFLIHGDSIEHPGQASHGCIVLPHAARVAIWESGDHQLQVD